MLDMIGLFTITILVLVGARRVRLSWKQIERHTVPLEDERVEKVKFYLN